MKYTQGICKNRIRLEARVVRSVASLEQLNVLPRLLNKQHLVDAFSRPDYWVLTFKKAKWDSKVNAESNFEIVGKM